MIDLSKLQLKRLRQRRKKLQQKRQKQQKAMLDDLKKGDKVVTASGFWGTITNLGKETVTLQIADNTKVKIQKEHIARLRPEDDDKE